MAGTKEIKRRLVSVKNTKKITYAMKLVSAAKLKKAQNAVTQAREYVKSLDGLLNSVLASMEPGETDHPLCSVRTAPKNIGIIIIGGSRGLCGGYNTNVNRRIETSFRTLKQEYPGATLHPYLFGKKVADYFRRTGKSCETSFENLPEDAQSWDLAPTLDSVKEDFVSGKLDRVYVVYTHFYSALTMTVELQTVLPFEAPKSTELQLVKPVLIEPNAPDVFGNIIDKMFVLKIRQAALHAKASEQASRMTAMDSATKNAGDLINKLQLQYNKLRQSSITSELLDIIGGAEAANA